VVAGLEDGEAVDVEDVDVVAFGQNAEAGEAEPPARAD
jgi:hypothetical protein